MSKQTATKRPASTITAWLKKEPLQETDSEESEAKILKKQPQKENTVENIDEICVKNLRVCLEPVDNNIENQTETIEKSVKLEDSEKENKKVGQRKTKEQNKKAEKSKDKEEQPRPVRRSARNLPPGEKPVEVPRERTPDIKTLPPILFQGKIKYYSDFYDIANICDQLLTQVEKCKENVIAIGFDLEWPFSFQTGSGKTALAQICMTSEICYLFHIFNIKKLPVSFIALLSHTKVKLVGVNVKNDVWKLTRDFEEFPGKQVVDNNCLDCGKYANTVLSRSCRWSLERLTAYLLKKRISKDPKVRKSKWHIHPLSDVQKLYAATDAYVSLLLHLTIEEQEALQQVTQEAVKEESI